MKRAAEIEIALKPRPHGMQLQRWLYEEIRAAILTGRLAPGARLPASRDLAKQCKASRGTVLAVFAQLGAEGYLNGAVGRGSFVTSELPDQRPGAAIATQADLSNKVDLVTGLNRQNITLSARGRLLSRTPFKIEGLAHPARAFRPSQPDVSEFPFATWARIAARQSRLAPRSLLASGDACGFRPLRAAIAEHLRAARGIVCSADNVLIASSVQQVLDLSARLLLDPGDEVWMEDPGYLGARMVLEATGANVVGVPVDSGGMKVAAGRASAPNARLAYVTAGRQSPLGYPLALDRRLALLAWADEAGATVIEDDYDSEYRFEGSPLAAMKSLDDSGRVIYAGTFSKLLFPSLRLAYAVLPGQLVEPFSAAMSLTCRYATLAPQTVLHEFIAEGHFGRHVRRMRVIYGERAQALRSAADMHLAGLLHLPTITTGLDAPAFLAEASDDARVTRLAAEAGVEVRPLSFYAGKNTCPSGLVLGFAAVSSEEIEAGARTLAQVLEPLCNI
ncbi:MAG: PLP-dependent aminotransferase family protein [Gammaproteobacteria bacterium]|nr:PLP-dependent aminotransferase family protein [Gammaproteobacteria bacterium]